MSDRTSVQLEPIRLVFKLERADNPRLYDDLIRFKKGAKRVNRLRTLAQDGLLVEHWPIGFAGHPADTASQPVPREMSDASITNQVFDQPVDE